MPRSLERDRHDNSFPMFVTDPQGNVLLSNESTAVSLGLPLARFTGSNVRDLVRQGYYDNSVAMEAAMAKREISKPLRTVRHFDCISTCSPLLDQSGLVKYVVVRGVPESALSRDVAGTPGRAHRAAVDEMIDRALSNGLIVARNDAMRRLVATAQGVARTDCSVVLLGETGTGKEIFARFIHESSRRRGKPFVAVNAAAFPEELAESELFGYERGAFTGARAEGKIGLFEAADGGTLFLDEIADLSLPIQAKLLRVLESGDVRRIGGARTRRVDCRIIVATNRNLADLVAAEKFREDVYYRLSVFTLEIPPLRQRRDDIVPIAERFIDFFGRKYSVDVRLDMETANRLLSNEWRGNVRELRNWIENYVVSQMIGADMPAPAGKAAAAGGFWVGGLGGSLRDVRREVEDRYIRHVLEACGGRVGETADRLEIYRTALYRRLKSMKDPGGQAESAAGEDELPG